MKAFVLPAMILLYSYVKGNKCDKSIPVISPDLPVTMATSGVLYLLLSGSGFKHKTPRSHFLVTLILGV